MILGLQVVVVDYLVVPFSFCFMRFLSHKRTGTEKKKKQRILSAEEFVGTWQRSCLI